MFSSPCGLMFHHFLGDGHIHGQGALRREDFASILDQLGSRVVCARQWMYLALTGKLDDQVCITFDDGLKSQYDVARPELEARDLAAFFFIYTSHLVGSPERLEVYRKFRTTKFETVGDFYDEFITRVAVIFPELMTTRSMAPSHTYLHEHAFYTVADRIFRFIRDKLLTQEQYTCLMDSWIESEVGDFNKFVSGLWVDADNIRSLASAGHVIGLHAHNHPTTLVGFEQYTEYYTNREILRGVIGYEPTTASYPSDLFNFETHRVMGRLNVLLGFRAKPTHTGTCLLQLPREDCADLCTSPSSQATNRDI